MIEDFSSGYYRMSMVVEEYDDGPAIERDVYDYIVHNLYGDITDDVVMRVGLDASPHFRVTSEHAIPQDVLALPEDISDDRGEKSVFVLKPEYASNVGKV